MEDKGFGRRLRGLRELRGLSQQQLAEKMGQHPSAISNWESGRREPTLSNLLSLADSLNFTPGNLLPNRPFHFEKCDKCGGRGVLKVPMQEGNILR